MQDFIIQYRAAVCHAYRERQLLPVPALDKNRPPDFISRQKALKGSPGNCGGSSSSVRPGGSQYQQAASITLCDLFRPNLGQKTPEIIFVPITSFDGPLLGFKKSRSRGKDEKVRQEKAKMRKKTKHLNVKNPHTKCGGFSGSIFTIKLGKI